MIEGTMKLTTHQFGEVEFDESIIINFDGGILGFDEFKKFIVISEEDGIFCWLTSVDEPEVVFPLFPINALVDNYPQENDFEAYGIVKLEKNPKDITLNMKAPIYLNHGDNKGFQKIIDKDDFPIDYKLFIEN